MASLPECPCNDERSRSRRFCAGTRVCARASVCAYSCLRARRLLPPVAACVCAPPSLRARNLRRAPSTFRTSRSNYLRTPRRLKPLARAPQIGGARAPRFSPRELSEPRGIPRGRLPRRPPGISDAARKKLAALDNYGRFRRSFYGPANFGKAHFSRSRVPPGACARI